jgi:ABC-2 type transport system ATP-binding protein
VTALSVERLSHRFGTRRALEAVEFALAPGSFTVLLGPNGAGKTTLVSLASGLYAAQTGDIRIFGHDIRREPLHALAKLGVIFQAPTLDLDLTVSENLAYHGALHGLTRTIALARGRAELDRLDMADRLDDTVRSLSGGLRRRVEVARALLHEPRLLIVDEGTVGLDVASRRTLLAHGRALCRERGVSVLWVTHLLDEVEPDDALMVLHAGGLRWLGPASDLSGTEPLQTAFLRLTGGA